MANFIKNFIGNVCVILGDGAKWRRLTDDQKAFVDTYVYWLDMLYGSFGNPIIFDKKCEHDSIYYARTYTGKIGKRFNKGYESQKSWTGVELAEIVNRLSDKEIKHLAKVIGYYGYWHAKRN